MRLDQFGGTSGKLSRVNLHVIFDPSINVDVIRAQFVGALQAKVVLAPGSKNSDWSGVITKQSLADLGRRIKETVPSDQLANYSSDLVEGFNNINVRLGDVKNLLDGPYFRGKALTAIGKTEWRDIKWNDQSIAAKKTVINSSDIVFTAYQDAAKWEEDVERLREDNVNHKVLDCSDAHFFSDSDQHMRLGACQTWINSTPSFAGLSYAIGEFKRRVYVGLEPPALAKIRRNPEQFIDRVRVNSEQSGDELFNHDVPLNSGFVAVVGNKGQGKSALLDCIALGGNSTRNGEFAFLSASRFLSASNRKVASRYSAEVIWASGISRKVPLTQPYEKSVPVGVEYLPQSFVERVCNGDPGGGGTDEFEAELRNILFTHIPESEKSGEKNFEDLLAQKTQASRDNIQRLKDELRSAVDEYVRAVSFQFANRAEEVQRRLEAKGVEIDAAKMEVESAKSALSEFDQESDQDGEVAALRKRSEDIEKARAELLARQAGNAQARAQARQHLANFEAIVLKARAIESDVGELNRQSEGIPGWGGEGLVRLEIDESRYAEWRATTENDLEELEEAGEVIDQDLASIDEDRRSVADSLAAANGARERARQHVMQAEERLSKLEGTESDEGSQAGLRALLARIMEAPAVVESCRGRIFERSHLIYLALQSQLTIVKSLYEHASSFIATSEVVKNAGLEFNAELRVLPVWESLSSSLDRRRNGDFTDWLVGFAQRLEDSTWAQLEEQLSEALSRLEHEKGEPSGEPRDPASALRGSTSVEDFLVGLFDLAWLEVRFGLTGDGQPLSQLSPGQRGLVLALFYLVVDRRTTPLLLDQPEENLDNETIASKLVPAIYEAAGRRQTIVVTHNANLAIVGDADQIIHCQMRDSRFFVSSGSIADVDVARFSLDVLEGTKPAFDNRRLKYDAFPALA